MRQGTNAIEAAKASLGGDPLRIRDAVPALVAGGFEHIALVPAVADGCVGFNVIVGGKMGCGGFTVASPS